MRDYGIVSPKFWIGQTGKGLRGNPEAQVLALYLMTSPHSTMTGVFHCPILYMAHETGLSMEGASKALASLIEAGFCEYEEASETVFVIRMAAYQIGESLKPGDKRVIGLRREVDRMPESRMKQRFMEVYGVPFALLDPAKNDSPSQGACKPHRSQDQEQEQEQDSKRASPRGSRLPHEELPKDWREWALSERPDLDPDSVFARFADYWRAQPGAKGRKSDWLATWRNWVRDQRSTPRVVASQDAKPWAGAI